MLDRSLTEPVWFWYDPNQDRVVQEVEPSNIRGLFDTTEDAYRFLDWYTDQYDITDTSYWNCTVETCYWKASGRRTTPLIPSVRMRLILSFDRFQIQNP